ATRLHLELLEQSAQLECRARPTMRHQRVREGPLTIERPADDRRPWLTTVSTLPSTPSWPFKSAWAGRLEALDSFFEVVRPAATQKDQRGNLAFAFADLTLERRKRLLDFAPVQLALVNKHLTDRFV